MRSLKHVIMVNDHAYINGGQAKVAIESTLALRAAGVGVTFFSACGPVDERLAAAGVEIICLGQHDILDEPDRLLAARRGIWNTHAARRLVRVLSQHDPASTIVHCHGFAKALSPAIGPVITTGQLGHVYTMHEYFLACPNGGFFDYGQQALCTRRPLGKACLTTNCDARHRSHKAWRVLRQAVLWGPGNLPRRLSNIVYLSETQRRAMARYIPASTRLHHLPNPIAREEGKPRVSIEANDVFLFVGRLNPEKGGLLFARAAQQAGVRAVFVGDGPESKAIMEANRRAEITGWLAPREVDSWLTQARCLVFPSLWYECHPLAPLEALSRGVPVVCGSWTAAAENIASGKNGLILDSRRPEDWAAALKRLSDVEDARALGQRTYARGHSAPSPDEHCSQFVELTERYVLP
jgi:glycosyltransferase involved in cell wall biosynthesis